MFALARLFSQRNVRLKSYFSEVNAKKKTRTTQKQKKSVSHHFRRLIPRYSICFFFKPRAFIADSPRDPLDREVARASNGFADPLFRFFFLSSRGTRLPPPFHSPEGVRGTVKGSPCEIQLPGSSNRAAHASVQGFRRGEHTRRGGERGTFENRLRLGHRTNSAASCARSRP